MVSVWHIICQSQNLEIRQYYYAAAHYHAYQMKIEPEQHRQHYYAFQSEMRYLKSSMGKEATRYSSAHETCIPLLLFDEYYLIKIEDETRNKFLDLNNHIYIYQYSKVCL